MAKKSSTTLGVAKTMAMRIAQSAKIPFEALTFESQGSLSGVEAAERLGLDPTAVFKTLVVQAKSGDHYVFMIPVRENLDLKKAAASVGEKSVAMIPQKDLKNTTGYIHGGCSPLGMKRQFVTVIDQSALGFDVICFSAGKIGVQMRMNPQDLAGLIDATFAPLCA